MSKKPPRVGRFLIYGLLDPRDGCLRYIGKTHKRRELRLAEHQQDAVEGLERPLHHWIRELLAMDLEPGVFVIERVPPDACWEDAEKHAIQTWRNWPQNQLPYFHPPQTPKSHEVKIERVDLLNIRGGG